MASHIPTDGFGKVFEGLFRGSMVGQKAVVFTVWVYAITHMKQKEQVCYVELSSRFLSTILKEDVGDINAAIAYLESPDPETRTEGDEGARLVWIGEEGGARHNGAQTFRVVNGFAYRHGDSETGRRAGNSYRTKKYNAKKSTLACGGQWDGEEWERENPRPAEMNAKKRERDTKMRGSIGAPRKHNGHKAGELTKPSWDGETDDQHD